MRSRRSRLGSIIGAALLGAGLSLALASPAFAHTEVEIEPAQAGAPNALITVNPEAHNHNAGATSVQVILPEGIAPADVTLVSAPAGWTMTTDATSYTVAGPQVKIDAHPRHQVRVRQLPTDPVIYFKVLTTYADGKVDRYIELPSAANPTPENGAPGVALAGGTIRTTPPPTTAPPANTAATVSATSIAAAPPDGGDSNLGIILAIVAAVLVLGGLGVYLARRRRA